MQTSKIIFGFIKPIEGKYKKWYVLGMLLYLIFTFNIYNKGMDGLGKWIVITQIPFVFGSSLPILFPKNERFQLYIKFGNTDLIFRNNYLKKAQQLDYKKINTIDIKATQIKLGYTNKDIVIPFNMSTFKQTQKIKANFEQLKQELNL